MMRLRAVAGATEANMGFSREITRSDWSRLKSEF